MSPMQLNSTDRNWESRNWKQLRAIDRNWKQLKATSCQERYARLSPLRVWLSKRVMRY